MPAPVAGTDTPPTALTADTAPTAPPHEFERAELLALADEQFTALPLLSMEALLWPPLPPTESADALPDLPVVAVQSPSLSRPHSAVALPVCPEVAVLRASPPLAS